MHADLLDLALLVVAAAFAVSGYRQGFIVGALSFAGFLGGAVAGALFAPAISRALVGGQNQQDLVAVIILVLLAIIGQFAASAIGTALRSHVNWRPAAFLDSVGGAAVSVLSVLLIAWVIGSVLVASPFSGVVAQVNNSAVLRTVDRLMPSTARTMFSDFRRLLASGPFPEVFSGIGAAHVLSVAPADPAVLKSAGYLDATNRVFKVRGTAPSCSRVIEGSGFVYAPDHILTNAHVVAGVAPSLLHVYSKTGTAYTGDGGVLRPAGRRRRAVRAGPECGPAQLRRPGPDGRGRGGGRIPARPGLHRRRRPGSATSRTPPAPTSTRPARSPGRSTRSRPTSSRVTPVAR